MDRLRENGAKSGPFFPNPVADALRFVPLMRPGTAPYTHPTKPPPPREDHDRRIEQGLVIERNCRIRLRDGVEILCDLYRPEGVASGIPILLAWGPYGKHALSNKVFWPRSGVDPAWLLMNKRLCARNAGCI